jgi:hypothetical protein
MRTRDQEILKLTVGLALNLGDYQSLRVDVGVERPSERKSLDEDFDAMREDLEVQLKRSIDSFYTQSRKISSDLKRR